MILPLHVAATKNVALNKPAVSSSFLDNYLHPIAALMVDGDPNPNYMLGHCFHSSDGPGGPNWAVVDLINNYNVEYVNLYSRNMLPERLDYFIVGLTSVNYSGPGLDIIRGTYPLCGQYGYKAVISSKHTLKCYANLVSYRYVIVQQPANGAGSLTICELEVYPPANPYSKFWNPSLNCRLTGHVSCVIAASRLECLIKCLPGECGSFNFKADESICELNQHLQGYSQTDLIVSSGWSFYQAQYA
ncbi:hypothetical protein HELRODRAFT_175606 [Helobdella robusta]|uniref:Apple domain-containing protein n=1 Tax=Helobdella robusta TaxID=6412 RepID=T1F9F0_HELRO|nr:hypothetical protein HELRODRAFT_175606 [Helobdella robusta]ESO00629.1 hypothetical protein HELRODRAFT_175606 [Helobdella robusta]